MHFTALASLSLLGFATAFKDSVEAQIVTKQVQTVNGTVEYRTVCKTCPYTLCPHLEAPWGGDVYSLTCWTYGDRVGDSQLWLKTTTGCYLSEYDLVEYAGDFREDLASCGQVPYEVTEQPAQIRYLTECKWGYSTSAESITYYGRDLDLTLLCWAEGGTVYGDSYWYKTTDNCCVSGSGLWETPDRSQLDNCGPAFGPRINESVEPPELPGDKKPTPLPIEEESAAAPAPEGSSVARRWLQPEQIGEEYSYCRTCPSSASGSNCRVVKVYEYNQTVVSQCTLGNDEGRWMLTTDWCYVNGTDFWEPPWDHYRYPACSNWGLP